MAGGVLSMVALALCFDPIESPKHIAGRCIQEAIAWGDSIGSKQRANTAIDKILPAMEMFAPPPRQNSLMPKGPNSLVPFKRDLWRI